MKNLLLIILFLLLGCSHLGCSHFGSKTKISNLSILQGLTTNTTAQFSIVSLYRWENLKVTAKGGGRVVQLTNIGSMFKEGPSMEVSQWEANDLELGTEYTLFVKDSKGRILDHRLFRVLDTSHSRPKVAVVSCIDDKYRGEQKKIWNSLIRQKPDIILMIGDNVYADKQLGRMGPAHPGDIWRRYLETRNTLEIFRSQRLIPILAVWDDHDYGWNNGNKNYKYKEKSKEIFEAFYAQKQKTETHHFEQGPGVSSVFKAFDLQLILLDNRSFRDEEGKGSHWGLEQEKWLMKHLNTKGHFSGNVIINGDQFFGGYHPFESFEGHRKRHFTQMMKKIFQSKFPSLFISGDRHLFELMEIPKREFGYKTYEITSSGIHAKMFPSSWGRWPNPRQVKGIAGIHNYTLIQFNTEKREKGMIFHVQNFDGNSKLLFEKRLKVTR